MSKIKKRLEELEKKVGRKRPEDIEKREDEDWSAFMIRYMKETGTTLEELVSGAQDLDEEMVKEHENE